MLLYKDKIAFCRYILPHHFTLAFGEFQKEIFGLVGSKDNRYCCVVAPRGHSKSSIITLGYLLHAILFMDCAFALIVSDTYTQGKMFLDAIKSEIETNEKLIEIFGKQQGLVWGEGEIETASGIKVMVRGAEQKIRGLKHRQHRPDLVIVDDVENEELTASPERREKLAFWFYSSVLPSLADTGRLIIVGTILHYDSLLNKLSKSKSFKTLFYKAIKEDGTPLWKEKFSIERLMEIKENYSREGLLNSFYTEYMNEPISDENSIFKKSMFKYYEFNEKEYKLWSKFITVDLAISEREQADYTVVMVCGVDSLNNIYVIEYRRGHFSPIETIEIIFELHKKHQVKTVGIESVAYQKALIWFLNDEMKRRNTFMFVEELKADMQKERRIRGLQPRYAVGTVFHRDYMTELEEELLRFPKGAHDDLSDSLAYLPQIAFQGNKEEIKVVIDKTDLGQMIGKFERELLDRTKHTGAYV